MRALSLILLVLTGLSCRPTPPSDTARRADGVADLPPGVLPPLGLAVVDTSGHWCAVFAADSLRAGQRVTLVLADSAAPIGSRAAEIRGRRASGDCATAFAQPQFSDSAAYDLVLLQPDAAPAWPLPSVTLAVASPVPWSRGVDGMARADVDGDGALEEARVCQAGEGQHFTLWRGAPENGPRRRVWHGYFDWGAEVEPTCQPEETARAVAPEGAP